LVRTPGVDNILIDTPRKRWEALKNLNLSEYKAKPLKRIYIPKKNGKKRPLGIPARHDRVEQALDLLGLDPVSESTADHHSYGFRKSRSAQDAIGAVYNALRRESYLARYCVLRWCRNCGRAFSLLLGYIFYEIEINYCPGCLKR